jgi:pimeloyl-ACP methyl ester carboxylesterase
MAALRLHARTYAGEAASAAQGAAEPLVLVHGLFGSGINWHGIARRLAGDPAWRRTILVPDLRNHGESPWGQPMDYPAMAADLGALLAERGQDRAHLVGHSMGGKAAMWLALTAPEQVASLTVADIAPVTYPSRFRSMIDALRGLSLETLSDRREADRQLAEAVPVPIKSPAVRGYLLQNLVIEPGRAPRWRVNLDLIADSMDAILGFPDAAGRQFPGPTLFLYGSRSDYVTGEALGSIRQRFPLARLRAIPNAGHWVYADQPEAFVAALAGFVGSG